MRTSLSPGGATSISSITRGLFGSQATAALHLITWREIQAQKVFYASSFSWTGLQDQAHELTELLGFTFEIYCLPLILSPVVEVTVLRGKCSTTSLWEFLKCSQIYNQTSKFWICPVGFPLSETCLKTSRKRHSCFIDLNHLSWLLLMWKISCYGILWATLGRQSSSLYL